MDAWGSPQRIGLRHLADQLSYFASDPGSTWDFRPAQPAPVEAEATSVPSDDRFGLDDVERFAPVRPDAAEEIPEGAVTPPQARSPPVSLEYRDLVAEGSMLENQRLA